MRVYVDGFNLYYRALRKTPHKWLNVLALSRALMDPADSIETLRYFTARISPRAGDPEAPKRQQAYLSALRSVPQVRVHYGRFLTKKKWRPRVDNPEVYIEVHDTEEKGSDVNLASFLLHDGWQDTYDIAFVISQDTDLCEPLRMVRDDLRKPVGVAWLDGQQPSKRIRNVVSFVRHVTPARLSAAQFEDCVMTRNGRPVRKPAGW